jgi:Ankyrin repeats (3 copies)
MNKVPPDQDPADDVDAQYRRASALDPSRPGEAVRRAVLAHAAQLAAERASGGAGRLKSRRTAHPAWWRPAIFGTLAAAGLAGLVIAPQWLAPRAPPAAGTSAIAPVADNLASEPAMSPPAASAEITAKPPASARSANLPAYSARARPKTNVPTVAPAVEATPLAQSAGSRAADSSAAVAGVPAARQRLPGNLAGVTSSAAAPRVGPNPAAAFRHAAEVGDLAALATLVENQTDIDARDDAGRTALMVATLHGEADAVAALLAYGADPNAADANGTTPLQAATAGDHPAIVATLRRYGAR